MDRPYPPPPTSDTVYRMHGEAVADPFRPLEDPDDPATRAWVEAQNALTEDVLSAVASRPAIRERIAELWDYPRLGAPMERGGRYFQMRNSGLQSQSVLYVAPGLGDAGTVLIDPNTMSEDGTVSLTGLGVSTDGRKVAYATSEAGSDWMTWRVRDVRSGIDEADRLEWSKFSGAAWTADGAGFFYAAVERPAPGKELTAETRSPRIMYHRLGTNQDADTVEFEAPDHPDWFPAAEVTASGRYLVVTVVQGTGTDTLVLLRDLERPGSQLVALAEGFAARDLVVADDGDGIILFTDRSAERGRLVRVGALGPDGGWEPPTAWRELVAEGDATLTEAHLYGGRLVCHYLRHACSELLVFEPDGRPVRSVELPGPVALAAGPSGSAVEGGPHSALVTYQVVSFLQSGAVWAHDLASGDTRLVHPSAAPFDPDRFLTEQVFVESDDGTEVPVFLTRPRDAAPGGANRVLLYGYGGFAVPVTPAFSVTFAAWLDRGGIVAVANLRGGGEYGRSWHEAGRLGRKQNVFDDFAACARWLDRSGWAPAGAIAISGASNGGLLVGASITQHPELFGAAVAEVGVHDMLRFHLFTIGWAWKSDYGDPDDAGQYRWLRAYSPLHNVRAGVCYPPTLIMTGDHDDRVVPAHSYKFAAALQEAQGCSHPVLLRVATAAGHGLGKPTAKLIDEAADRLAFLESSLSS